MRPNLSGLTTFGLSSFFQGCVRWGTVGNQGFSARFGHKPPGCEQVHWHAPESSATVTRSRQTKEVLSWVVTPRPAP